MTQNPENSIEEPKKRPGRPKGAKNKGGRPKDSGIALRQQRKFGISLTDAAREAIHPDLICKHWLLIWQGVTPMLTKDANGDDAIIPDPNPLLPAPTLEQRNAAVKELAARGYGLPSQSVTIDAEFRNKIELQLTGISEQDLLAVDAQKLFQIAEVFRIKPGEQEITDAELVDDTVSGTSNTNNPLLEAPSADPASNNG